MDSQRGPVRLIVSTFALLIIILPGYAQVQPSRMQGSSAWATQESSRSGDKSSWITLGRSGAVGTPDGPELHLSVTSKKSEPLEIKVTFKTPGPGEACELTKTVAPSVRTVFACPQTSLQPDRTYPVMVDVFKQGEKRRADRIRLSYRFGRNDIARLEERIAKMRPGR
jgi:hypothetical protein